MIGCMIKPGHKDRALFLKAVEEGVGWREYAAKDRDEDATHRPASTRGRQPNSGLVRVNGELDLHGYFREDAIVALERFIESSFEQGRRAVLVITGKGINSPSGPVIKEAVQDWLKTRGRHLVAGFQPAPKNMGGSGALVVFMKRKSD